MHGHLGRCMRQSALTAASVPWRGCHQASSRRTHLGVCAALQTRVPVKQLGDIREFSDLSSDNDLNDLELRDVKAVSYVSRRRLDADDFDPDAVDEEGLPLVYNEARIAAFWGAKPGELASRWAKFAAISAPWLTQLANALITGQLYDPSRQATLAADAVNNLERLGPTFIKLGQILSIRPDVLPPSVMRELAKLQDRIEPFSTPEARAMLEKELGAPIDEVFSEFGEAPVAAASLAQVYRAVVRATGEVVAVKVQRPGALATISKDLYVMRRAVGVYERLVRRFTAQTTDYQLLLSTFAEGLYTELDFRNEALNAMRMRELMDEAAASGASDAGKRLVIPKPLMSLTTRRVLTMQWVPGVKLTTLSTDELRGLVGVGQEAFLVQLLEVGFFHGDPHPGNLLKVTEGPDEGKLALLDFGLVAEIPAADRAAMVSATIHLANRDWDALVDDFIELGFLPQGSDRGVIIPVMERVLGPYLRGGGAAAFNFTSLSQDLLSTSLSIPFSVPPYMSLLARSVATLEGVALVGDPQYQMVAQAYPFVVRKVLRNDSTSAGGLLRAILYDPSTGAVRPARLAALLQAALGYVAEQGSAEGFVDFDALPDEGAPPHEVLSFLLSPEARELRPLLASWLAGGLDLAARDRARRAAAALPSLAPRLPLLGVALPLPPTPPLFVPGLGLLPLPAALDLLAPPLDQQEEVYLQSLLEVAAGLVGVPVAQLESPSLGTLTQLMTNPGASLRELQSALLGVVNEPAAAAAAREVAARVVAAMMATLAARAGVSVDQLFPFRRSLGLPEALPVEGAGRGGSGAAVGATGAGRQTGPAPASSSSGGGGGGARVGSGAGSGPQRSVAMRQLSPGAGVAAEVGGLAGSPSSSPGEGSAAGGLGGSMQARPRLAEQVVAAL